MPPDSSSTYRVEPATQPSTVLVRSEWLELYQGNLVLSSGPTVVLSAQAHDDLLRLVGLPLEIREHLDPWEEAHLIERRLQSARPTGHPCWLAVTARGGEALRIRRTPAPRQ